MSLRNPVIWQDGAFLRPNHFQQQARYHDYMMRRHARALCAYNYGFGVLQINKEALLHGHFSLMEASGIFPDGTVFELPNETKLPPTLDLGDRNMTDEIVYLCLPLWTSDVPEILTENSAATAVRYHVLSQATRDMTSDDSEAWDIDVGQLQLSLMLESDDRSAFSSIALARIREKRSDGVIILDETFMPTAYDIQAVAPLRSALNDFSGLATQRAQQMASRLGGLHQGGVAGVADFMMLQMLNRWEATFKHLISLTSLHPERLFENFAAAASELASFSNESRRAEPWPAYRHDALKICFEPLLASLRRSLSVMLEPNAIALPISKHKYGILTAPITERALISSCIFVLAVRASVPLERLAKAFPAQVKISSIEKIRELISLHLPGVSLQPMATAPRQLPYHAGYTYFLLDHNSAGWKNIVNSSGFAFHIAGEFPDLEMEFWAIRGRTDNK